LIILPVPYYAKSDYATIRDALTRRNIPSHLVGVDTDQDDVFLRESIAVTHIYRAKGNEAPMVYIANANRYLSYFTELTGRNMLFTAITRSRAWIRIFGIGDYMDRLIKEINATRSDGYKLRFTIPTQEQQKIMERVHVTVTPEERELQRENAEHIKRLLSAIKDGTIKKSDFSKEDRRLLAGLVLDEFGDVDE
jgi:superfamily I DNA and RNA helicase